MMRSTRTTKRIPMRYSEDEYVLHSQPRKTRKTNDDNDARTKETSKESRVTNAKGNSRESDVNISIFGSPVLRDRTNLVKPTLKSDVLKKKGTSEESRGKKPMKKVAAMENEKVKTRKRIDNIDIENCTAPEALKKKGTSGKKSMKQVAATKEEKVETGKKVKNIDIENNAVRTRTRRAAIVQKEEDKKLSPKKLQRSPEAEKIAAKKKNSKEVKDSEALVIDKEEEKNPLPRKSQCRSIETGKKKEIVEKKFFKKKSPGLLIMENIEPAKKAPSAKRKIVARDKPRFSTSFKLRQTTLQESFMKQNAKKNLRPRRAAKNYCDESTNLEKSKIANEEKGNEKKLPIYKTIKLTESRENNPSEIYEFEYNSNDSLERMTKKRKKKRLGVKTIAKKSQKTAKKFASVPKVKVKNLVAKIDEAKNENKIDDVPVNVGNEEDFSPMEFNEAPQEINLTTKQAAKPIVVECIELKGDARINSAALRNSNELRKNDNQGLRATSAFVVEPAGQFNKMSNHVLLNKSLSPISKAIDSFDPGSPWRAPTIPIHQFSRVRGIVQSTPQINSPRPQESTRILGDSGKTVSTLRMMIGKKMEKNSENSSPQLVDKPTPKKSVKINKSPRKFGTEISNAAMRFATKTINESPEKKETNIVDKNVFKAAKSPRKFGTEISNVKNSNFMTKAIVDSSGEISDENIKVAKSTRKFGTEISNVGGSNFVTKAITNSPKEISDENIKVAKSPRKFGTEISNVEGSNFVTKAIIESPKEISDENIKVSKSPRKFGTEISNVEGSNFVTKAIIENPKEISDENIAKSPRKFGTEISNVKKSTFVTKAIIESPQEVKSNSEEKIVKTVKSPREFGTEISNTNVPNFDDIDEMETSDILDEKSDKENSAPLESPQKKDNFLESPRRQPDLYRSPTKFSAKTNLSSQAGPSGLQKRSPLKECRLLRQSNLNNFLNIENLPTSTRIKTIHGIFDDGNSEPIEGKPINAKVTKEANVENAFGFDDDGDEFFENSIVGSSTVKFANPTIRKKIVPKDLNNKNEGTSNALTARLSVGEIKKHLQQPKTEEKNTIVNHQKEKIERKENEKRLESEEQVVPTHGKIVNFSDTFDLSIEPDDNGHTENLLFADLEPVHFKQPPRHLYKRKRAVARIAYSDDEDEDRNIDVHDDEHIHHGTKRRKITKIEKQRQKKLEEWAKDVNETFEEIDNFDLIVE